MPLSQNPKNKYLVLIILFVGLGLLFITQYIFNIAHWFNLDLTPFRFLDPLACILPNFCNTMRFPSYGFIALLTATLAAILFGGLFTWQKIPNLITEPGFCSIQPPNRARLDNRVDVPLFVIFGLSQSYVITQAIREQPISPAIWLLGLITLLLLGWRLDQSREKATPWRLLSPMFLNGMYVSGIALSLLTTAAIHSQRWSWALVFGIITTLLWLQVLLSNWKNWDTPRRTERLILPLITLGSFLLFSNNLSGWNWSFWGDEYAFYQIGKEFADGTLLKPILSGAGVYEIHPILSSAWQGATMWLLGSDGYGWRVSNSLLLAISIPFLYYFLRPILGRAGGLFAVTLYGSAHVLITLGHYGTNNVQVIFVMSTSLAAFVWSGRRGSWGGFLLTGICLGLGFYTFAVARIYSLILAIWLTIYYFPVDFREWRIIWKNAGVWLAVTGAALLTALPVLSTRSAWAELARQTLVASEVASTPHEQFTQFLRNTIHGLTSFLFNNQGSHWIFGAHADPITSTLMLIGLTAILIPNKQNWKVRSSLLASYIIFVIIIAGTQQYDYPSVTRIFSFIPFYATFAAIGLLAIFYSITSNQLHDPAGRFPNMILAGSIIVIAGLVVPLNFWESTVLSQQRSVQHSSVFLLQTAQMSSDEEGNGPHIFYVGDPQHEYWLTLLYSTYNIPKDRFTFVLSQDVLLPNNIICQSANQPAIVMIATEISNAEPIAADLRRCFQDSKLNLVKDMNNSASQYRLISKSALPFIHYAGGYWIEQELDQTAVIQPSVTQSEQPSDAQPVQTVYQPVGFSQDSKGQLAIVDETTNQIISLNSKGEAQDVLADIFIDATDFEFLPDDGYVVSDTQQGLLWFDYNGNFQFTSYGGTDPHGLFIAADGTVYIASTSNQSILQSKTNGEILRVITGPQFQQPTSVAVALDGRIAVGDPTAGKVTINSSTGELVSEYSIGVGNIKTNKPGLLWLRNGDLIYTDPSNNRVIWVDTTNGKVVKEWSDLATPTDILLQSTDTLLVLERRDNYISSIYLK